MHLRILLILAGLITYTHLLSAQASRSFDGQGNNPVNPDYGSTHSPMPRWSPATFADGYSSIGGSDRPNPRAVSNAIFAQDEFFDDPRNMSDYTWVWGQFIDHDLTLVTDSDEFIYIQVPQGDTFFDPWNTGAALIPLRRSGAIEGTGTEPGNPLQYPNEITAFIDGSAVYGSSAEHAAWLRSFEDGKLKVSDGNLLPYNTLTGELDGQVDPTAPHMEDATGQLEKLFVAGDVRVNENVLLIAMHTIFVREHNRLCDEIKEEFPNWVDEVIFRVARRRLGAIIAAITYEEWLPAMGVHLPAYTAYNSEINPGISNEFSAAAFRLGHTLLTNTIQRMDMEGNTVPAGNLSLLDAFFKPEEVALGGGLDPLFKGMATQIQQQMDGKIIDDVRNFLFGPAGAGGLDLASINIARGRERGLADFNTIRTSLGLSAYTDFTELTGDEDLANVMENDLGYTINNIDPWVGMMVEKHMPDALFGETVMEIMHRQFLNLRDGDRYYYENDPALTPEQKAEIKATRMRDIVMRNTNIPVVQENLFFAMPHEMLCTTDVPSASLTGELITQGGEPVEQVILTATTEAGDFTVSTDSNETGFLLSDAPTCETYTLTPSKNIDHDNGVTTSDLVRIRRHILQTELFTDPYSLIAADANNNKAVTAADLVEIRKLILVVSDTFASSPSWRFVDADYQFSEATNPWLEEFPESITTNALQADLTELNFIAVKIGDVNNTVNPSEFNGSDSDERDEEDPFVFSIDDEMLNEGQVHTVGFRAEDMSETEGFQFTLNYNPEYLEFVQLRGGSLPDFGVQNFFVMPEAGAVTLSWNSDKEVNTDADLFTVAFKAKKGVKKICEVLTVNSRYTKAEAYFRNDEEAKDMAIRFNCMDGPMLVQNKFEVYQNFPNPVTTSTKIGFYLPEAGTSRINFTDITGKVLRVLEGDFVKGYNEIEVNRADLNVTGIVTYTVETAGGVVSRQMVL